MTSTPTTAHKHQDASFVARAGQLLDAAGDRLRASMDRLDVVLVLTLLFFVVHSKEFVEFPMEALALLGLFLRRARRHWAFWAVVALVHLVGQVPFEWSTLVNHRWLAIWWAIAISGSLMSDDPQEALRRAARPMIGFVFLFATIWKLISPEFADGTFFEYTLLTDDRFRVVAQVLGGVDHQALVDNHAMVSALETSRGAVLTSGPTIAALAQVLAIGTIVVEGLVAALFLWPTSSKISRLRGAALLTFVVATYPLAPVVAFAWLLISMALAQSTRTNPRVDVLVVLGLAGLHVIDQGSVFWEALPKLL